MKHFKELRTRASMRALITLLFSFVLIQATAQIFEPVKWDVSIQPVEGNEYEIVWTAEMESEWSVYSQYLESDDGPIPTTITINEGDFELLGRPEEDDINRESGFDAVFEMNLTKYHEKMVIRQRVIITDPTTIISGSLMFMTCDDVRCLAPKNIPFEVSPSGSVPEDPQDSPDSSPESPGVSDTELYGFSPDEMVRAEADCGIESEEQASGFWQIFILGMLGGLLALLTPCVFPMIPLTVSFFTKSADAGKGNSHAVLYGVFIVIVYVLLSIPFHLLDSITPDILNNISTNIWLNILFFGVFMVFAFSFFGYFEITLPASWTNKASSAEGVGGILGVFFMALTLSLVSFSCTGPILGTLLAGALTSTGGAWQLTAGMAGFGLSLALPFALFALFPNWLQKIPKSGGWLNTIKVTLGFVELALALKFLSNADLVQNWGLLKIEIFLGLWIVIAFGLSLYLFGRIRFSASDATDHISWARKGFAMLSLGFAAYLATGFQYNEERKTYEPLTLLSGLAPPVGYSILHPSKCPNNINCFNDLQEGMAFAKKENKPIMLDFTGYACVNCRKMEEHVWPEENILNILNDDYVLVSLYVDYKKELPAAEQVNVERINGGLRKLENYGNKWAHFQTKYFQANSQPYYVLLSPDAKTILSEPVGYTPEASEYQKFLECGLDTYKNLNPFGSGLLGRTE